MEHNKIGHAECQVTRTLSEVLQEVPLIISSTSERGLTLAEIVVDIQLQNRSDYPEENHND